MTSATTSRYVCRFVCLTDLEYDGMLQVAGLVMIFASSLVFQEAERTFQVINIPLGSYNNSKFYQHLGFYGAIIKIFIGGKFIKLCAENLRSSDPCMR